MKWIFLLAAMTCVVPLSGWMRRNGAHVPKLWALMGVLLFLVDPLHLFMAIVSWNFWPGFVKGFEVTITDIIALAIYLSLRPKANPVPFRLAAGAYLIAVVMSAFQSSSPEATMFYAWQLIRMFFVFAVTTRACANDERVAPALLKGMAIGIVWSSASVCGNALRWERSR